MPLRSSPYWPVLTHRLLRRVLPGLAVSALGDGMALVAVSWLALQLAPAAQRGTWVAVAVAAYSLPAALGTVLFGRFMAGRPGAQLAGWSAVLRAAALGAIPIVYLLGGLSLVGYVALLAVSALLASWGQAGRYTLVAELLPRRHHLAANAVLTAIAEFATIVGPPLAGILIGRAGPVLVIAIDAASFAVLALTYRLAVPAERPAARRTGAYRLIWHDRSLLGLLALTCGFFFLFGPVYVALPIHVAQDLYASATVLGAYYTAFGIGAVAGAVVTGYLRRWPLWPTTVGIVIAFAAAMLPLGLGAPAAVSLPAFAAAGMIWAPYMSTSMALFQRDTAAAELAGALAAYESIVVLAIPFGAVLGGPLVTELGASTTLLACATATLAIGVVAACLSLWQGCRERRAGSVPGAAATTVVAPPQEAQVDERPDHRDPRPPAEPGAAGS
jgi:DHA3 family macrolide efflux protein-like MFS transporter